MRLQQDAIRYGNSTLRYTITRSAERETVAVTVAPDGAVAVAAPKGTRRDLLAVAVTKKADWILHQQEFFRRQASSQPKQFVSGESLYYLGRQFKLKVRKSIDDPAPTVQLLQGQFLVRIPATVEKEQQSATVKRVLQGWYRIRAGEVIRPLVDRYAEKLGLTFKIVQIRDMQKRWGSGGKEGRLAFNWRIVMAPKRLIEYVVSHELCHLVHNDHSRDFWRLLEKVMPECERRRLELAIQGSKYDLKSKLP